MGRAVRNRYLSFLNWLHRPFVRPGEQDPYHQVLPQFQSLLGAMTRPRLLELGSRNVTGITRRHLFQNTEYTGFDYHPGDNVDVVGDCHKLSSYFGNETFDAVCSTAVFEHLVSPWKVVLEINRVLKRGGYCYVATHPCWPAHELPWDFWRFPVGGLASLFSPQLGFELVAATEGLPCRPYSLVTDPPTRPLYRYIVNGGVAVIAKKTHDYDPDRFKWEFDVGALGTEYPAPKA